MIYMIYILNGKISLLFNKPGGGGGGHTLMYGLYRCVPLDRVWLLRFSILK